MAVRAESAFVRYGANAKKIRILHAVGGMNRGGTELLLLSVLRHFDRNEIECDILVREDAPGGLDEEVRRLGSRILKCAHGDGAVSYIKKLTTLLRTHGPYDAVHSHTHFFDGLVLTAAAMVGVPIRISHSHASQDARPTTPIRLLERMTLGLGIRVSATHRVGVSERSYVALFRSNCENTPRSKIIQNGIDLEPSNEPRLRATIRRELGIPEDARVLGHVGRFDDGKNHSFLLSCFDELCARDDKWQMLLVGDGPLRRHILGVAAGLRLRKRVFDVGVQSDVDRFLRAMDVFVFPSKHEGFGIAMVEAQARGLPCVASTGVPKETDTGLGLATFLDLKAGPAVWAEHISTLRVPELTELDCRVAVATRGFDVRRIVPEWLALYETRARTN